MNLSAKQTQDFAAAFHDFDTVAGLVDSVKAELLECKTPGAVEHLTRIAAAEKATEKVKDSIRMIGDVYRHAVPFLGNVTHVIPKAALLSIKGGTAALSAIHYDAAQFLRHAKGEAKQSGGLAQLAEWGILGAFAGITEKTKGN